MLALLFPCCVILSELSNIPQPQYPHMEWIPSCGPQIPPCSQHHGTHSPAPRRSVGGWWLPAEVLPQKALSRRELPRHGSGPSLGLLHPMTSWFGVERPGSRTTLKCQLSSRSLWGPADSMQVPCLSSFPTALSCSPHPLPSLSQLFWEHSSMNNLQADLRIWFCFPRNLTYMM